MTRLQKLLAEAGFGSRRTIEEWIRAGRLTVAGRTARLGDRAGPGDDIRLDGHRLELAPPGAPPELLLYYKPAGEVTTRSDPAARPTVFERLPAPAHGRWISIGRLDVNTSGLLLLTTDGVVAHRLMHPSGEIEREYLVRVRGRPGRAVLDRLLEGVTLEDGPARFDRIEPAAGPGEAAARPGGGPPDGGSHSSYRVVLHEGRYREVRRLWQAVGFEVSRLLRVRYGPIELPRDMRPGSVRSLGAAGLERLAAALATRGSPARMRGAGSRRRGSGS
ncbi:MAG TPA: pseudouridine synthase [Steroidobacteraceae bacterium]|nr:pseudouridine synthase [Steroidobacteraceae bacterium]